jgi:hypothetical protein
MIRMEHHRALLYSRVIASDFVEMEVCLFSTCVCESAEESAECLSTCLECTYEASGTYMYTDIHEQLRVYCICAYVCMRVHIFYSPTFIRRN